MQIPLTVALTTYNRSHYLKQALTAILEQTYGDFEILVLDNGSTDDTPEVVLSFKDERLRYVRNAPGYTSTFNSLSAQWISLGERLLITHDDDIMERDMLERQMALIRARPELTAVWTNKSIIDAQGQVLQPWLTPPGEDRIFERGEYIARAAEENLWHPPSSLIFFPRLLMSTARLRTQYRTSPDRRQTPRTLGSGDIIRPAMMNLHGPVAFLNAPLLRYRQHGVQETHNVHVAQGALHSFQTLRKLVRKTSYRSEYEPLFDAHIARFKAQDQVIRVHAGQLPTALVARLSALLKQGAQGLVGNPRAAYPLLPLLVLLQQVAEPATARQLLELLQPPAADAPRWVRGLYRWALQRVAGENLFASLAPDSKIVILGSVLVAAALIHEAREAGHHVLCCLDANITRQGNTWLGVPIVAHAWLSEAPRSIDLIVLSSERDHEDELQENLRRFDPLTPIVSWKTLAQGGL
jgi:hypothetical protein